MDIIKDIVDKYSTEPIIAYLDIIMSGVLQNYGSAIKADQPQILFGNLGDITQVKKILHEMRKRNDARDAMKNSWYNRNVN